MTQSAFLNVRAPAVAGLFYPADPQSLGEMVRSLLDRVEIAPNTRTTRAVIVPHAGLAYSGAVAAQAYGRLRRLAASLTRVVVIGPCHRVAVRGLAVPTADAFETPLGFVPVDRAAIDQIARLPQVAVNDLTHRDEHSIEVQLPFIQESLGEVAIIPLIAGRASADEVADVLDVLADDETALVISSDLSHYLDYAAAKAIDAATCRAIEALDDAAIDYDHACGRTPVGGMLALARRRGLRAVTLDLCNSGDTAGGYGRVVGYGSWMFVPARERSVADRATDAIGEMLDRHGRVLLDVAAASIDHGLCSGAPLTIHANGYPNELRADARSFVTLTLDGRLRGCVGSAERRRPLVEDVAANAFAAAFQDSRFDRLTESERVRLGVSVSVLTDPVPLAFEDEADLLAQLRPGRDGLIIEAGDRRGLFLPQVWRTTPEPADFLRHLKRKAGVDAAARVFSAWRFAARSVSTASES